MKMLEMNDLEMPVIQMDDGDEGDSEESEDEDDGEDWESDGDGDE